MAMQGYEEAGTDLAQLLNKKENITAQKAAMSPDIAKALAKLANGLYVVTAAHSSQVRLFNRLYCQYVSLAFCYCGEEVLLISASHDERHGHVSFLVL